MRLLKALRADIKFQFRQGFYFVYIVLTALYMVVIGQLPATMSNWAVPIVVFSDPSVVGFFFIGGIVMLEKLQGVLQYLVVTPLRTREYLLSKVISLALLAEVAGFAVALVTYEGNFNWILLCVGIFLTSAFFTLYGFIVVAGCSSINQYFVKMVPYMLVIILPCLILIRFPYTWVIDIFPGVAGLKLILGAFHGIGIAKALIYVGYLTLLNLLTLSYVEKFFDKKIIYRGDE